MSDLMLMGSGGGGAYSIENSLVFEDASFEREWTTEGNKTTYSHSCWVKRGNNLQFFLSSGTLSNSNNRSWVGMNSSDEYNYVCVTSGLSQHKRVSNALYRDPAYWMHVLTVVDTTEAAADDRLKYWIDGVLVTSFSDDSASWSLNETGPINDNKFHYIGWEENGNDYGNWTMAEVVFLDGIAATPDMFGEFHPDCPQIWRPIDVADIDYSGTHSCHLDFKDATSATTLGYDVSGNGNHWTPDNIATTDQSTDTPTNNSATFNPIDNNTIATMSEGNKKATRGAATGYGTCMPMPASGVFYWEVYIGLVSGTYQQVAILKSPYVSGAWGCAYINDGDSSVDATTGAYGATYTTGDTIGVLADIDASEVTFYKNNVSQGAISYDMTRTTFMPAVYLWNSGSHATIHFNEDEFTYTPPAGATALMTKYLPVPTIKDPKKYFDPQIYTGSGAAKTISTQNKVDHVITKCRDVARSWANYDSVRGATEEMVLDTTAAETTQAQGLTAFGAETGYDLGSRNNLNGSGDDYVAYPFTKSPIAGMDIVTTIGDGSIGREISHNLGVPPEMMTHKRTNTTRGWGTYFEPLGNSLALFLDTNAAADTPAASLWNNTSPTATVFTVGNSHTNNNLSDTYIHYLFASVEGFSKVFSYKGNALADGPFVYCGFKPAFVMIKRVAGIDSWKINDIARTPYNESINYIEPDVTLAEQTDVSATMDMLSTGFKVRTTTNDINGSGLEYVGIAFAEYPFALLNNSEL